MDLTVAIYGAALLGGAYLFLRGMKSQRVLEARAEEAKAHKFAYGLTPVQRVGPGELMEQQVRGKRLIPLGMERGSAGTIKYAYEAPDTGQLFFSSAPLDMHKAM
jgi:hypothetical protein